MQIDARVIRSAALVHELAVIIECTEHSVDVLQYGTLNSISTFSPMQ